MTYPSVKLWTDYRNKYNLIQNITFNNWKVFFVIITLLSSHKIGEFQKLKRKKLGLTLIIKFLEYNDLMNLWHICKGESKLCDVKIFCESF